MLSCDNGSFLGGVDGVKTPLICPNVTEALKVCSTAGFLSGCDQ